MGLILDISRLSAFFVVIDFLFHVSISSTIRVSPGVVVPFLPFLHRPFL